MIRLRRLKQSFIYACRGLVKVAREEQNFKIELFFGLLAVLLALWSKFSYLELAILVMVIGLVLLTEIINSAVELISDVLKPQIDHYVKTIKDMMATAVMTASLIAILVGLLLFGHHWWAWQF